MKLPAEMTDADGACVDVAAVAGTSGLLRQPNAAVVRDPETCGGVPTLAGTRIGVHHVVGYARVYSGDLKRVRAEALPDLSDEQISAAMNFYDENSAEIDELLKQRDTYYHALLSRASRGE